eukprot:gene7164-biopygen16517
MCSVSCSGTVGIPRNHLTDELNYSTLPTLSGFCKTLLPGKNWLPGLKQTGADPGGIPVFHTLSIFPQWVKRWKFRTFWGFEKRGKIEKRWGRWGKMGNSPHFPRPGRPGPGRAGPGLWRGTQAVAPKASQPGCREAARRRRRVWRRRRHHRRRTRRNVHKLPGTRAMCVCVPLHPELDIIVVLDLITTPWCS